MHLARIWKLRVAVQRPLFHPSIVFVEPNCNRIMKVQKTQGVLCCSKSIELRFAM